MVSRVIRWMGGAFALVALAGPALAQAPVPGPAPDISGPSQGLMVGALAVLGLAALVGGVWLLDRRRRREQSGLIVQADASDALLRDAALSALPVTVTVLAPFWRSTRIIEVRGDVPSPAVRAAVLRLVEQEAVRHGGAYRIDDLLMVLPPLTGDGVRDLSRLRPGVGDPVYDPLHVVREEEATVGRHR